MTRARSLNVDEIIAICQHFRFTLEHTDNLPDYKMPFPMGWCGATSRALGAYLIERGYSSVDYVFGYRGDISHAWLEIDGWIIDITADQFGDFAERVFVSRDRSFHNTFTDVDRRPATLEDALEYPASLILRIAAQE